MSVCRVNRALSKQLVSGLCRGLPAISVSPLQAALFGPQGARFSSEYNKPSPIEMSIAHASRKDWYPYGMKPLPGGVSMQTTIDRMSDGVEVGPMQNSRFVKPYSISYTLDGKKMRWDAVESHPAVACILVHKGTNSMLLVRQFRPAVYAAACRAAELLGEPHPPMAVGFTYELCAGIIDKAGLSLTKIMQEEISEECGYHVEEKDIQRVTSLITALGISGPRMTIYYAEVDEHQAIGQRGGVSGEAIEVLSVPLESIPAFLADEGLAKSASVMFAVMYLQQRLAGHTTLGIPEEEKAVMDKASTGAA